jgi:hypothetical protein
MVNKLGPFQGCRTTLKFGRRRFDMKSIRKELDHHR